MKANLFLLLFITLGSVRLDAQGWLNITPAGLNGIERFKALEFQDGSYEITAWNYHKGFSSRNALSWDTIQVYWANWCGINEYQEYRLVDFAKAFAKPNLVISYFLQTGCIVEGYGLVCRDTTGMISKNDVRIVFDDITMAGLTASVCASTADSNIMYVAYFDSVYRSGDGGLQFYAISSPVISEFSSRLNFIAVNPSHPNIVFTGGWTESGYRLFRSTDAGYVWHQEMNVPETRQFIFQPGSTDVTFWASDSGVYMGTDPCIPFHRVLFGNFRSVAYTESGIFAGSNFGELYRSTDGGNLWHIYNNTFTPSPIIGLYWLNGGDTIIACSNNGIYKVYGQYILSTGENSDENPYKFILSQNHPNPFNPTTAINYYISTDSKVNLKIYNSLGQDVITLVDKRETAGTHSVQWNGKDRHGNSLSSGLYLYRIEAASGKERFTATKKMVYLK